MKTYQQAEPEDIRSHPWTVGSSDASSRYLSLRDSPELIRTSLEDLLPWSSWPATEAFYQLLEWINGEDSLFESSDCAFEGPVPDSQHHSAKALEATGRVMVFWRELRRNVARESSEWLEREIHEQLASIDSGFDLGVVGTTLYRTRYLALGQNGFQLILSFWSWGDTEGEVMTSVARTLRDLDQALHAVERRARERLQLR